MTGQNSDSSIIKAFREKGYKATPQRIAISRFALHNHNHPTAEITFREVKKIHPTVSLATIYKTIKILKEIGLIQELNLPEDQTRFDPNMEHHIHLVCSRCKCIRDWTDPLISEIIEKISDKEGFVPETQNFDVFGICRNCNGR
jgi:Fur family peroxide stress response transcriptional regulator